MKFHLEGGHEKPFWAAAKIHLEGGAKILLEGGRKNPFEGGHEISILVVNVSFLMQLSTMFIHKLMERNKETKTEYCHKQSIGKVSYCYDFAIDLWVAFPAYCFIQTLHW